MGKWIYPFAACLFALCFFSVPTFAQGIIRDTEIESDLRQMATPIWQQAGLRPDNVRIVILQDNQLNAFVAGGQNIFLYTGLISRYP